MEGVLQFALAIFPKSAAFINPGEGALNDPALRQDSKRVELIALNDLDICSRRHGVKICVSEIRQSQGSVSYTHLTLPTT